MTAQGYYKNLRGGYAEYARFLRSPNSYYGKYGNTAGNKAIYEQIEALTKDEVAAFEKQLLENKEWGSFEPSKLWMSKFLNSHVELFSRDRDGHVGKFDCINEDFVHGSGVEVGKYTIDIQESYGGEGDGDSYWCVVAVSKDGETTTYWRYDGYYSSGGGGEYHDVSQVKAQEQTVTVWV